MGIDSIEKQINTIYQQLQQVYNQHFKNRGWNFFALNLEDIDATKTQLTNYLANYRNQYINVIPNQNIKNNHQAQLQQLQKLLDEFQNTNLTGQETIDNWEYLFTLIPNFILFNSFDDIIPNEVPFEELEENEFIKDLSLISDLDTSLILSDNERHKAKHKQELNVHINKEYKKFWVQDITKFSLEWNSDKLFFWIEEDGELYRPSERSKGKQWHMSFYTKVSARALEEGVNLILIDEPGLFLHAAAQKDIYNKLINISKDTQILFTTHSPYLIDRNELHRIRLVLKPDTIKHGTRIENKIHAKADKETLTPILTAIGLGIYDGIQNVQQQNNVVVEGPSDYFYLQGLKKILKNEEFNVIFGGGAGNIGNVGAILTGWGCQVVYLFDNDKGKKDGTKNLTKKWNVSKELIHSVKDTAGTIEDLFSKSDFKNYVLKDTKAKIDDTNSVYVKKKKLDKVFLAKQFNTLCYIEDIKLTKETISSTEKLFQKLRNIFKDKSENK